LQFPLVSWFLPLCARQNILSFLCLSFSKHNASKSLLGSIGFLFVHLNFIWFFFNLLFFPSLTFYTHLVFWFLNFAGVPLVYFCLWFSLVYFLCFEHYFL
jgi:hypothetical protein